MQQHLLLAVLKLHRTLYPFHGQFVLMLQQHLPLAVLKQHFLFCGLLLSRGWLKQYLSLAVCDEGCEAAEEQSDDEARTSLVPDRREGKTKVMK